MQKRIQILPAVGPSVDCFYPRVREDEEGTRLDRARSNNREIFRGSKVLVEGAISVITYSKIAAVETCRAVHIQRRRRRCRSDAHISGGSECQHLGTGDSSWRPRQEQQFSSAFTIAGPGRNQVPTGSSARGVSQGQPGSGRTGPVNDRSRQAGRGHMERSRGAGRTDADAAAVVHEHDRCGTVVSDVETATAEIQVSLVVRIARPHPLLVSVCRIL